ncbi:MAG: prepilin-type N-terminal cleavage/methylation domain-containing protein [Rhodoferax sp.]|nr:prepilin-type N-terminal cleavage/methylation domain-containing protein [Rhodoferax sp.]
MKTTNTSRRQQLGFTIVEALIAMAIMGFGILGLAGMQAALSRNADTAKQRTEALRLAQEKIEQLRSYAGIDSTAKIDSQSVALAGWDKLWNRNWDTLPATSGSDNPYDSDIITNATYTRTWTLSSNTSDPAMRNLTVNVAWLDRAGESANVSLSTILAKSNPADAGFLAFPLPLNTTLKRPKNRNLDIPIPSIDLGNGKSAVNFKDPGKYILFDNITGDVTNVCNSTLAANASENAVKSALTNPSTTNTGICPKTKGYIVSGYVDVSLEPNIPNNNGGGSNSASNWSDSTIKSGLNINHAGLTYTPTSNNATECQFDIAINQNTNTEIIDYKYYLCLISWPAPGGDTPDNQVYQWNGTMRLAAPSTWNSSSTKYYVCRFQYAETSTLKDPNQRNVQAYVNVNQSIDQQNYFAAYTTGNPSCNGTKMNVDGVSTGVLHQDCKSSDLGPCPTTN